MGNALTEMGELEAAVECYKKAIEIKPDHAEAYGNMGFVLKSKFGLDTALYDHIKQAFKIKPNSLNKLIDKKSNLKINQDLDAAVDSFEKAVEIKPNLAKAQHLLASINGKTPVSAPKVYVKELIDNYASKFEYSLVENLQYNVPNELTQMIMTKQSVGSLGSVLDLGCGTGLAGVELKPFCCHLEGIDLSHSMIEKD